MKRMIPLFATASLLLTGCYATRIVTVAPDTRYQGTYSTTVTIPRTNPVTTTTRVTALSEDISLCLDLQAIGAAFAQSSTVQDFENLINNSSYMLSNLDLNQDGYVDYLRVVETVQGGAHIFVIQAVLAPDVYQDVATLVAEVSTVSTSCHVQIIGAPYIYGPSYIIEPVFVLRPVIYSHLLRPYYKPWRSPWYWGYYPSCYRHPRPIFINHYHAYVNSYMRNHHYCHDFHYAPSCHYPAYEQISRPVQRNDYGVSHPERSFSVRNANIPANDNFSQGQTRAANAREIRESLNGSLSVTRSGSTTRSADIPGSSSGVTGGASRTAGSNSRSYGGTSTNNDGTGSATGTAGRASSSSTRSTTGTTSGSTTRAAGSSASRATGSSTTRATGGSSVRSSSAAPQTTVRSNVRASGTSNTRISTVSPNGTTSTTRRSTSGASTKSSSGTSTRSSSASYRSGGTSTRSSSSSSSRGGSRR